MPLPPAVLEVYYSPACESCRRELPALAIYASHEGANIRIVILEDETQARRDVAAHAPRLLPNAISATAPREAALAAAGDSEKLLPYARSINSSGRVCARWVGRMTLDKARALLLACKGGAFSGKD